MKHKTILEMDSKEAKKFLLKSSSYFTASLPTYINLQNAINKAVKMLKCKTLVQLSKDSKSLPSTMGVNHKILVHKDGNYSWRPLQILHPIVYVDLVNEITKDKYWKEIRNLFEGFREDKRIECISIPLESTSEKSDTAETILNWWSNIEQAQIKYALDYDYCIHTDISDCYSSIYTHSIPWAIHSKKWSKKNRKKNAGIGNIIDSKIMNLQNGQTNGIPQGSVLMDFIAEIVLGYADKVLIDKIQQQEIGDFQILRYRDDYRIFSNRKDQAEVIIKLLSEVLSELNLKINSSKTFLSNDIILDAIKPDKKYWELKHATFVETSNKEIKYKISLQKHLLEIKKLGDNYSNCGSLCKALSEIYKNRISSLDKKPDDIYQLISILVDIMRRNPRTVEFCIANLGRLFDFMDLQDINLHLEKILTKFLNTPNIDTVEIWLQRLSIVHSRTEKYKAELCKKVLDPSNYLLWNSDWLNDGFDESDIINESNISELSLITSVKELELFASQYDELLVTSY